MTREQRLQFCRKCSNRELDMKKGLICQLTKERADFDLECSNFQLDPSVDEEMVNRKIVPQHEEQSKNARRDIIIGILLCGGGLVFTIADTGYIFYGAIIVGAFQLIKGLINSAK